MTTDDIQTLAHQEIESQLPGEHPAAYYIYAGRLFTEEKKDASVLWFYIGQLRYRIHLSANPGLDPSGDPALFASLNATLGQTINEYAGGHPNQWAGQIAAALSWDEEHPNSFTPKDRFGDVHREIRSGLESMQSHIRDTADQIRQERTQRGLENRE